MKCILCHETNQANVPSTILHYASPNKYSPQHGSLNNNKSTCALKINYTASHTSPNTALERGHDKMKNTVRHSQKPLTKKV